MPAIGAIFEPLIQHNIPAPSPVQLRAALCLKATQGFMLVRRTAIQDFRKPGIVIDSQTEIGIGYRNVTLIRF